MENLILEYILYYTILYIHIQTCIYQHTYMPWLKHQHGALGLVGMSPLWDGVAIRPRSKPPCERGGLLLGPIARLGVGRLALGVGGGWWDVGVGDWHMAHGMSSWVRDARNKQSGWHLKASPSLTYKGCLL